MVVRYRYLQLKLITRSYNPKPGPLGQNLRRIFTRGRGYIHQFVSNLGPYTWHALSIPHHLYSVSSLLHRGVACFLCSWSAIWCVLSLELQGSLLTLCKNHLIASSQCSAILALRVLSLNQEWNLYCYVSVGLGGIIRCYLQRFKFKLSHISTFIRYDVACDLHVLSVSFIHDATLSLASQ